MKKEINIKNFTNIWFILSIFIILTVILFQSYIEYKRSIENAIIKTNNLTILLAKKLENDFQQIDNILNFTQNIIVKLPKENKLFLEGNDKIKKQIVFEKFNALVKNFKDISVINFIDKNGNIIYSSNPLNYNINISDRAHFQIFIDNKDLIKSFSNVIISRTTGKNSVAQLLAVRDENKELIGVLAALIDIDTINNTLSSINTNKGGVALLRNSENTELIARYPMHDETDINKPLPLDNPISLRIKAGEKAGSLEYVASTDNEKRVGSFVLMGKYPFYVQVALSEQEYLAQWKKNLTIVTILLTLFIVISIFIFLLLKRSYKKEQIAINELKKNRDLFSSGPVITIEWDYEENFPIKYISKNCENILGYKKEEMLSVYFNYMDLIHPDDINKVQKEVQDFIENGINNFEQSYRIKMKDGVYKYFYDYTNLIRDEHNSVTRIVGYMFDQSNLKEKEDSLIIERNRLANIITGTNAGTWEWNVQTNEVIFNEKWAQMIGYTLDEISPTTINTWMRFVQPDDLEKSKQLLRRHFNKELDYYESEMRMKHKNGSWIWIEARGKVISWNEKDEPIIMMGTHIDVTKEKTLIQEMEIVKNRFENMFKTHSSVMLLINPNNQKIIDANQSAVDFYGYSIDELKGMDISKINLLAHQNLKEKYTEAKTLIKNSFIFFHKLKNGTIRTVEVNSSPIETESGLILFSIIKDVTKEQELKNEILKEKIKFQTFINLSSDAIFIVDINTGKLLEYSKQTQKYLGYNDDEMQNLTILDWDRDIKTIEDFKEIISTIKYDTTFIERVHKRKDGSYYDAAISLVKIKLDGQEFIYSSARDITNEKIVQKKLEESYKNLERLIESQDNIVILTDGENIKFANQKFFDFLGFENLDNFKKYHKCICEFFLEKDKFFYKKDTHWINEIKTIEESKRIVSMIDKDFKEYAFSVSVNKFDEEEMIVSFTDISQTILKNISLEEKIIRDKLTNAYNREFFDKNYKKLIYEYNTNHSKLAVAMLDIDHFKLVNDTYGHDVGDEVLIQFVEIINNSSRKNDILIRWGGEEFILVLQLNSENTLPKILENLRKAIEEYDFPKIGKKTCSIGGTIYQENEDIIKTIKRADEAVYEAKAAGRNKVIIV
ncbi:PAS domain S-box protein [Aliarcobacter butzleri]|uniref:sensor domain-containing diguanylate cyclase n=1 Tax=Aliarcobacter butzleri TaxID=28197 RepID=UPI001EDA1DB0|nr:PAS domain S-box protein [Aliarcobacter butzleri]MCG3665016.1 PAS domain S-box protein [Aliarcobacter butzleri]